MPVLGQTQSGSKTEVYLTIGYENDQHARAAFNKALEQIGSDHRNITRIRLTDTEAKAFISHFETVYTAE